VAAEITSGIAASAMSKIVYEKSVVNTGDYAVVVVAAAVAYCL
jgi:hypothetical protein